MSTWYKATTWHGIEAVEVVRETAKFVIVRFKGYNGDYIEHREAIDSERQWYRRERDQAKAALLRYLEHQCECARVTLESCEADFEEAQRL